MTLDHWERYWLEAWLEALECALDSAGHYDALPEAVRIDVAKSLVTSAENASLGAPDPPRMALESEVTRERRQHEADAGRTKVEHEREIGEWRSLVTRLRSRIYELENIR